MKDCEDRASKGKDISPFHNLDGIVTGRLLCRPGQAKIRTTADNRGKKRYAKQQSRLMCDVRYVYVSLLEGLEPGFDAKYLVYRTILGKIRQ